MTVENLAERLGGAAVLEREIRSELDLVEAIQEGLSYRSRGHLIAADERGPSEAYDNGGSPRPMMRKRKSEARLSPAESDRLARAVRLIARAEESLSGRERAHRWLRAPNRALEGRRPLDLLDSDAGTRMVEEGG